MQHSAQARYDQLSGRRDVYLQRARDVAAVTIPTLIRPHDNPPTGSEEYPTPFQSTGARGTTNLAAKMMLALFPPGASFFRQMVDPQIQSQLADSGEWDEIEELLVLYETTIMKEFEKANSRPALNLCFKHLIVSGNYLLRVLPGGRIKGHPLTDFVVARDGEGTPFDIVVRESFVKDTLPRSVRMLISEKDTTDAEYDEDENEIWVYTRIVRQKNSNQWSIWQEVDGRKIPDSVRTEPLDSPSFIPLRWNVADGEDYGRGLGEEYLGDLQSLEYLTQSIVEFSAAAAKILFMVDPAGMTEKRSLTKSRSGDVVEGDARDVSILALDKFNDFRVAKETADETRQNLEAAFLLNSSVQRNAERVTAEEIRFMAGELEAALGGVYSNLSQELQLPIVRAMERLLRKGGKLPKIDNVDPVIVTGLEGLGRQGDLMKLDLLIAGVQEAFGPQEVAMSLKASAYIRRRAAALGLDIGDLVLSDRERQARETAAAQREQAVRAAPEGVKQMGEIVRQTAQPGGNQ